MTLAERIGAAAARVMEQHHVPGLSVAVVRGDELVYCDAFGDGRVDGLWLDDLAHMRKYA